MARIGIVIYSLAGGGAERVAVNLAHEFVAAGHAVDFVLASPEGELMDQIPAEAGVHVAGIGGAKGWRAAIRSYVDTSSPDRLLAMMEGAGVLAIQGARGRVPVFVVSHIYFSRHYSVAPRWKERWLLPWAARWYFSKAAGIIGVSKGVSKDIQQSAALKAEKVHTIYNPILTEKLYRKAAMPVNHPWLIPTRDWLTVVAVGRLTEQKDYRTLLRAVADIARRRPVRLMVLGQGEQLVELRSLSEALGIGDIVEFSGFDPNPHRYVAAADVFALSSAWEGLPTVLIEALACDTPVVSTDCPSGPSEILANGRFGQLVPVGDITALADAILHAKEYSVSREALVEHLKQFEGRTVAMRYLRVMGVTDP